LVGDTTFGKGSVQTIQQLGPDIGAKITTAYWYTPSGRCINRPRERSGVLKDTASPAQGRFQTLGNLKRVVWGGGAIVPDVFVPDAKLSGLAARIIRDAYFDFAVDYVNRHPGLTMDFTADERVLGQFKDYLR
ncbi:MAG: S41 family peptidase, partial [candidate division WOR-3 bacterium]